MTSKNNKLTIKPLKSVIKKKKGYKVKPTVKQKKTFQKTIENCGNVSKAAREAGYSEATAHNPKVITESKGWEMLVETHLSDEKLAQRHEEGLDAGKKVFKNNNETGEIELVSEEPDYAVRHKYLDTAYKIKKKYTEDRLNESTKEQILFDMAERKRLRKEKYGDKD